MIEGDICLSKNGNKIIMAHPPERKSDLSFDDWIKEIIRTEKGAKLDFKNPEVIVPCLQKLQKLRTNGIPIFLNADIIQGPGGYLPKFNPNRFISQCQFYYPKAVLSIGWNTQHSNGNNGYSQEMINKALREAKAWQGSITFCIRACYLKSSWPKIKLLLNKPHHTITLWNEAFYWNEVLNQTNLAEWAKTYLDQKRTFYDISDANRKPVRW